MPHRLDNLPPRPTPPDPGPEAIDPALHPLLDQALAPDPAPAGLEDRVLQQTTPRLPRPHVLARIGGRLLAAAAVVVLAAGLGIVMWAASRPAPTSTPGGATVDTTPAPTPPDAGRDPTPAPGPIDDAQLAELGQQLEALDAIAGDLDDSDTRLDLLTLQVASVPEDVWADSPDDLPEAMTDSELDLLFMGEAFDGTEVF